MGRTDERVYHIIASIVLLVSLCTAALAYGAIVRRQQLDNLSLVINSGEKKYKVTQAGVCVGEISIGYMPQNQGSILKIEGFLRTLLKNRKLSFNMKAKALFNSLGQFTSGELRVIGGTLEIKVFGWGVTPIATEVELKFEQRLQKFQLPKINDFWAIQQASENRYRLVFPIGQFRTTLETQLRVLVEKMKFDLIESVESIPMCQLDHAAGIDLSQFTDFSTFLRDRFREQLSIIEAKETL